MSVPNPDIVDLVDRALAEDIGAGDATTNSIIPADAMMRGTIVAKQHGVIAGLDIVGIVFSRLDGTSNVTALAGEGSRVATGSPVAEIVGLTRALLTGERTALNILGRMSGIATSTRAFVDAVAGTKAVILDTRKTVPGLRTLDKLAVRRGGGRNHRMGLFDMVLIKDNHIDAAGSIRNAVARVRSAAPGLPVEVEARTLADVREALELGVERILLDNMTPAMMREAVGITAGRARLEASGNVTLKTVRAIAETGVDEISVGALTHSPTSLDVSFRWSGTGPAPANRN